VSPPTDAERRAAGIIDHRQPIWDQPGFFSLDDIHQRMLKQRNFIRNNRNDLENIERELHNLNELLNTPSVPVEQLEMLQQRINFLESRLVTHSANITKSELKTNELSRLYDILQAREIESVSSSETKIASTSAPSSASVPAPSSVSQPESSRTQALINEARIRRENEEREAAIAESSRQEQEAIENAIANSSTIKGKKIWRNNGDQGKGGSSDSGPSDMGGSGGTGGTGGSISHKLMEFWHVIRFYFKLLVEIIQTFIEIIFHL
jgi:hypothetical protein